MSKRTDYVKITISKNDADIVASLIEREMSEIAKMKSALEERGIDILAGLNCRQIDLKYLLAQFAKAAETEDGE